MKSWWSCRSAAASWPTRPVPSAPSSTGMLHLDGAALAYRRDEGRVELVQPCSWSPWERPLAWRPVGCWGCGCSSPCCVCAVAGAAGVTRTRLRHTEVRVALHRRDRRRRHAAKHAEQYRIDYNRIRAHEAIAWTAPGGASGPANPTIPTFSHHRNPTSVFTRDNLAQFQVADRRQLRRRRPGRN
jgi:hypothetical protein